MFNNSSHQKLIRAKHGAMRNERDCEYRCSSRNCVRFPCDWLRRWQEFYPRNSPEYLYYAVVVTY